MQRYFFQRFLASLVIIFCVTLIAFSSIQLIPGDVVTIMLGQRRSPEAEAALRDKLGLNQPPLTRYVHWLGGIVRGDLGQSLRTDEPVIDAISQRLPVTGELALGSIFIAILLGVPAGVLAAIKRNSIVDQGASVIAILGVSMPYFWLATLLILLFSLTIKLLPAAGLLPSITEDPIGHFRRMAMPVVSTGLPSAAVCFRFTRSAMLEVVGSDYIRTAYAKGLSERLVILKHALRNALIPVVTQGGMEFAYLLGGAFFTETIFSLPGLGSGTVQSINNRDYILLQGYLLVYGVIVVSMTLILDVIYSLLDPRIRFD